MRRQLKTGMSKSVMDYFVHRTGLTQQKVADILQVHKSFITRLRQDERELSHHHLERLADYLDLPVGVMMISAVKPSKPLRPEIQRIVDLCERALLLSDKITEPARRRTVKKKAS